MGEAKNKFKRKRSGCEVKDACEVKSVCVVKKMSASR